MSKMKHMLIALSLVLGVGFAFSPVVSAQTQDALNEACKGVDSPLCKKEDPDKAATDFVRSLVNLLLFVLGAVSVIVIIFAGIFYTTSIGDQQLITKAKNTLLYAVIGLIVAISAYAIVNWVIDSFI